MEKSSTLEVNQDYFTKQKKFQLKAVRNVVSLLPSDTLEYIERLECMGDATRPINILVYGQVNHGKSSFLNAWMGQDQLFKTADVRTTVEIQKYEDKEHDIIWYDTPGLQADVADEKEANDSVKQADIVFLIHEAKSGELDTREMEFIKTYTRTIGAGKIRLILTKIDENKDEVDNIVTQINHQIRSCKISVFPVSSKRYAKGKKDGKKLLVQKSGFTAIKKETNSIRKLIMQQRRGEKSKLISNIIMVIEKEKTSQENTIGRYEKEILKKKEVFKENLKNVKLFISEL